MTWQVITGDCLEVMPTLDRADIAAVVTDPPYGIGKRWDKQVIGKNGKSKLWGGGANHWDMLTIDNDFVLSLAEYPAVIWGGNFYNLPPVRGWLIWDKIQKFSGGDFEMAWTNLDIPPRAYRLSRIDAYYNRIDRPKEHPTEKPLDLMKWCIELVTNPGDLILDPFCGSGTTGVACVQTGRRFIGIEIDEGYANIARERIAKAAEQAQQMELPV